MHWVELGKGDGGGGGGGLWLHWLSLLKFSIVGHIINNLPDEP